MKEKQNKLKLAKLMIRLVAFAAIIIIVMWMIVTHNPQSLNFSLSVDKINAEINVNFASLTDDDGQ